MAKDIIISVETTTRKTFFEDNFLGMTAENLQGNLIFKFIGDFVEGTPRVEVQKGLNSYVINEVSRVEDTYVMPIKSSLLTTDRMTLQLVLTQKAQGEEIPVFKSNTFMVKVGESINAEEDIPEEYDAWIEIANKKIAEITEAIDEVGNINITATKEGNVETVTITDKNGKEHTTQIFDGAQGPKGDKGDRGDKGDKGAKGDKGDAGIGIAAGGTIGQVLVKKSNADYDTEWRTGGTGGGNVDNVLVNGTSVVVDKVAYVNVPTTLSGLSGDSTHRTVSDAEKAVWNAKSDFSGSYDDLTNKPKMPSKTSDLTNDSGYITKSVNNLDNYTLTSGLADVATSGNYGDLINQPTIPTVIDDVTSIDTDSALSAYQGKLLNDRINNVESRGRFLALWNAATGLPTTEPAELPYVYKTGDWFRVGTTGTTNYMPEGSSYTGEVSTTVYTGSISAGDCFWYDGTLWQLEINHAENAVTDVQVNGTSIVSGNVANIPIADGNTAGITKASMDFYTQMAQGILRCSTATYQQYQSGINNMFIGKGTLENVLEGKGFLTEHQDISGKEDTSNKVTSISASSTDTQYPSAKAVYDAIPSISSNIVSGTAHSYTIWDGTRAQYEAIVTKDANTIYFIKD